MAGRPCMEITSVPIETSGKIECLAAHEGYIFLGTSDGTLLSYRTEQKVHRNGKVIFQADLECRKPLGSKKPVQEILIDGELDRLIVLCDGVVTLHDSASLDVLATAKEAKGASMICIDQKPGSHRLCVAVKKKLVLFRYGEFMISQYQELVIPDSVQSLSWYASAILVGYKREYSLLNDADGKVTELFPLEEKRMTPLIKLIVSKNGAESQAEALLRLDTVGVFVGVEGSRRAVPTRSSVNFAECPQAFGLCFPYVVGLLSNKIEIYSLYEQTMTPALTCKANLVADDKKSVFVVSQNRVLALTPVPYDTQIENLIRDVHIEEALDLFDKTFEGTQAEKARRIQHIHEDAAFSLFTHLQLDRSIEFFLKCPFADLRDLLSFFPELCLPAFASYNPVNEFAQQGLNMRQIIIQELQSREFAAQELSGAGASAARPNPPESEIKKHYDKAIMALQKLLEHGRKPTPGLVGDDLALQQAVDYALLRIYSERSPALLSSLFFPQNYLPMDKVKAALELTKSYNLLALLYRSKGQYEDALKIWEDIQNGRLRDPTSNALNETIHCLSETEDKDIVFRYARWVMELDSLAAVKIFTAGKRKTKLNPDQVLQFLAPYPDDVSLEFLEYLVQVENVQDTRFHTSLALKYITSVMALKPPETSQKATKVKAGSEAGLLGQLRSRLLTLLLKSANYSVPNVLAKLRDSGLHEETVIVMTKHGLYEDALALLVYKLDDIAAAEKYCVQHNPNTQSKDDESAASGSSSTRPPSSAFSSDTPMSSSENPLFIALLKTLLNPPPGREPKNEAASALLTNHAKSMNVMKVMEILPPTLPLKDAQTFLERAMRHSLHEKREGKIVRNLSKAENMDVRLHHIAARSRSVVVHSQRLCPLCNKRLGESVFAVYPNETVVHFTCYNRHNNKNVCPVTNRNFLLKPLEISAASASITRPLPLDDL